MDASRDRQRASTPASRWSSGPDSKCLRTGWNRYCCTLVGRGPSHCIWSRSLRHKVSDESTRTRPSWSSTPSSDRAAGFRVGALHRRTESDVAARESELVAGFCELEFCGLVTVTAANLDQLERSCDEWEQVAGQSGLQLRRLNGQHDAAFACSLPLGIGPGRRSWE